MPRTGLFASRWFTIGLVAAGVVAACGNKGDDDLFYCDRGSEGCPCASNDLCLPGLVCDRAADVCVEAVGSGGTRGSGGGPGTGGSGVVAGAPSLAGSGGSPQGTGGAVAPGGGKPSGGDTSSGGAGFAGAAESGGAGVAGSHGGVSGGDAGIAGSEQGGSVSTDGGAANSAGSAGDAASSAGAPDVGSRTIQIGGLLDAWVDSCETTRNNGSEETLSVDSDPCIFEIYIQPASLSDIPAGATLESALLELQCLDAGDPVQVLRITDEWSEESVNWDNRPSVGDEIGSVATAEGPVVVDITSLVEDWLGGAPMHGVALVQTLTDGSDYPSTESGQDGAPRILVTYKP